MVNSVTAGDGSIVIGGTTPNPTVETGTLDVIAADHPPAANWSNNSKKITSVANGSAAQDAAAYGQTPAGGATVTIAQGGTGQTAQQAAMDALAGATTSGDYLRGNGSHVVMTAIQAADVPTLNQNTTGTASNITDTLDQVPAPAANVGLNSHKITGLANGAAAQDAAAFGQIPVSASSIGGLLAANNLSDVASASTSRTNLGLGSAATQASSAFAQTASNLSDLASASTARTNLGLTGAATAALPISIANGGTGQTGAAAAYNALSPMTTLGDLEYESGASTASRLAGNTSAAKQFLTQTGTGSASAAPAWGAILAGDVPTLNQNTTGSAGSCTGNAATATNLAGGAVLPDYLAPAVNALTFVASGTTLVNAALGNAFNLTLTASTTTLGGPSNPVDGQVIRFRITQGTGGSFTLAYGSAYDFGAGSAPTLSTAAAKVDILGFEYVASISKWCYLGSGLGF